MRDPNRLYSFYNELGRIHRTYYMDLRFGQFMYSFFTWVSREKNKDIFYIEEDEMLQYLKEFVGKENV